MQRFMLFKAGRGMEKDERGNRGKEGQGRELRGQKVQCNPALLNIYVLSVAFGCNRTN